MAPPGCRKKSLFRSTRMSGSGWRLPSSSSSPSTSTSGNPVPFLKEATHALGTHLHLVFYRRSSLHLRRSDLQLRHLRIRHRKPSQHCPQRATRPPLVGSHDAPPRSLLCIQVQTRAQCLTPTAILQGVSIAMVARRTMTFGIVVGNRGFFPDHLAKTGREEIISVLKAAGAKAVVLSPEESKYGAVETYDESLRCAELFKKHAAEIDGIIVTL